jgi:Radical SAM superfamily
MRFPFRLTADLALGLAARAMRSNHRNPLILNIGHDGSLSTTSLASWPRSISTEQRLQRVRKHVSEHASLPIVWIGGCEPLERADIPRLVASFVEKRRHVFLQTNGILLRRRIHEFQPSSRLHLTVRFDGLESVHDRHAGRHGAYRAAVEGLRAARLSGFFTCAQIVMHTDTSSEALAHLHDQLRALRVDGMLIVPAAADRELSHRVSEAQRQFLGRRWGLLSRMLNPVALQKPLGESAEVSRDPVIEPSSNDCEEGAQA